MAHKFDEEPTLESRALQIWQILIGAAHNRQIYTYKIVSELLGYDGSGVLNRQLGHIMYWCQQNKVPPLTILVVNEAKGIPGEGLILEGNESQLREKVYKYDWYNLIPPSLEELSEAYQLGSE
ncbi:hypothetical protein EU508_09385 [Pseudoalteromonas fuliginea]|uniref:Uncharacterized protein n=1 Tax=Pseudoalteromonas fuliginea TaxID=1872678 RepID=A0AB73BH19_9GAMM|nr:hypothetical protein [Pseudoalteromonas fuliginea]KAA1160655.1 hypothetical protein EU508_09385 [Pseudoalteromonas fuliginea]